MPVTLTTAAIEKSTYVVTISFTDELDNVVVPNTGLTWSLMDRRGNIVNSRQDVSITPSSSVSIALSGDDLPMTWDGYLVLLVEGTYDGALGNDLPFKEQVVFPITDLTGVT